VAEAGGVSTGSELVTSPRYVLGVRCASAGSGVVCVDHALRPPDGGRRPGLARRVGHLGSPAYLAPSPPPPPPASAPELDPPVNGSRRRDSSLNGTSCDRGMARGVVLRGVVLKRGVKISTCRCLV